MTLSARADSQRGGGSGRCTLLFERVVHGRRAVQSRCRNCGPLARAIAVGRAKFVNSGSLRVGDAVGRKIACGLCREPSPRLGRSAMIKDCRRGAFCLGHFGRFQAERAANHREPSACGNSSHGDPIGPQRDAQVSCSAGQVSARRIGVGAGKAVGTFASLAVRYGSENVPSHIEIIAEFRALSRRCRNLFKVCGRRCRANSPRTCGAIRKCGAFLDRA